MTFGRALLLGCVCLGLLVVAVGFKHQHPLFVVPKGWPKPLYQFQHNRLSAQKVELGRALFYDPLLSADSSTSCASCHSPYNAFAHTDHTLSHGIGGAIGRRNAPPLFNLAWQPLFMRDGAARHLDMQALMPITNRDEMGETLPHLLQKLAKQRHYRAAFKRAWGDTTITSERMLKSLSQFLLTLVSADSKYDLVKRGQASFTDQELSGYAIFKQQCNGCHTEPLFTNHRFERNGLAPDTLLKDLGRFEVTRQPKDSLRFIVPSLRNLEFTYPYMHDGRFKKLSQVLSHYKNRKLVLSSGQQLTVSLDDQQRVDLMAFLLTLSDQDFLFDARHDAFVLSH